MTANSANTARGGSWRRACGTRLTCGSFPATGRVAAAGGTTTLDQVTAVELGMPAVPGVGRGEDGRPRPESPLLIDRFGRVATDLRVSLTDKCNLRCTYCMPADGLDWLPRSALLTDDEVVRLVRIGVELL